jgi:hypothetical protein
LITQVFADDWEFWGTVIDEWQKRLEKEEEPPDLEDETDECESHEEHEAKTEKEHDAAFDFA